MEGREREREKEREGGGRKERERESMLKVAMPTHHIPAHVASFKQKDHAHSQEHRKPPHELKPGVEVVVNKVSTSVQHSNTKHVVWFCNVVKCSIQRIPVCQLVF